MDRLHKYLVDHEARVGEAVVAKKEKRMRKSSKCPRDRGNLAPGHLALPDWCSYEEGECLA